MCIRDSLQSAFDELGIEDTDLFITHLHSDHCGLVPKFATKNSTIYASETDGELINFEVGNLYWRILDDLFIKYGFPKDVYKRQGKRLTGSSISIRRIYKCYIHLLTRSEKKQTADIRW